MLNSSRVAELRPMFRSSLDPMPNRMALERPGVLSISASDRDYSYSSFPRPTSRRQKSWGRLDQLWTQVSLRFLVVRSFD
jgi:hypothetical protein